MITPTPNSDAAAAAAASGYSSDSSSYQPANDFGKKQTTVGAKITYFLRWLAVIPGALLAGILSTFPLHLILYNTLTQFISPYPELPERILAPAVIGGTFVWAGGKIAPARKIETAVVLFGLWTLLIGGALAIALFNVRIGNRYFFPNYGGLGPVAAFIGAVVGFLIVRNEAEDASTAF